MPFPRCEIAGVGEAAVTGVRVVKGFGQEGRELDRLDGEARKLFGLRLRHQSGFGRAFGYHG